MKKELVSLSDIRGAAACLLAFAVNQRFPSMLQLGIRVTPLGFYCDFSSKDSFTSEHLKILEEVMQDWIRQKLPIRTREMVAFSAKEYFLFHKEPLIARAIEGSSASTVFLAEIAGKMLLSDSFFELSDLGEIKAFALQKVEQTGSRLRIYGTAFSDKQELKEFLKKSAQALSKSHEILGKQLKLFEEGDEGQWIWLPSGYKARDLLQKRIEQEEEAFGFARVSTNPLPQEDSWGLFFTSHQNIFIKHGFAKLKESATFSLLEGNDSSAGLLDPSVFQGVRSHVFCASKDLSGELISYLHFMTKIFKILGFAFQPTLFEVRKGKNKDLSDLFSKALEGFEFQTLQARDGQPRIDWNVEDALGRCWPVASIFAAPQGFSCSPCLSFERVLALLLEKGDGNLPFWLAPVHVRVVPLLKKHRSLAEKTAAALQSEGIRSELLLEGEELKVTLRKALEEGVAYVVVIGDKELETDTLTLRDVRAKHAQSLPWQELVETLKTSTLNGSNCSELQN